MKKCCEQARQELTAKGYDPDQIDQGIVRWMASGYGIDPNQLAFRHYPDDSSCRCYNCADTPIEGYNWHGLPPQYAPVVRAAWEKAGL